MDPPQPTQTTATRAQSYNAWKQALKGSEYKDVPGRIEEACELGDHQRLLDINPSFLYKRNILHMIIYENEGDFESVQEQFRLPIVQAMVETAKDQDSRNDFVNKADANMVTPLQLAAINGNTDIAHYLIKEGARVNSRSIDGWTPLHWAAVNLHPNMVKLLLEHLQGEDRIPYDDEFCTPADALISRHEKRDAFEKADYEAAENIKEQLGGTQRESLSSGSTCQIVALRDSGDGDIKSHTFDRPLSEVFDGSRPVLPRMRDRLLPGGDSEPRNGWRSYGVSLPHNNVCKYAFDTPTAIRRCNYLSHRLNIY